jgi:ADP-heptose:LPS heptosyltransferase
MLHDLISSISSAMVEKIFYLRLDAIGDAVLSSHLLHAIHLRWPKASITIACQSRLLELYGAAPFRINFIIVDPAKARSDQEYLGSICDTIANERFDLAVCPVYSREIIGDILIKSTGASIRIGHQGDLVNQSAQDRIVTDQFYTHLVPSSGEWLAETICPSVTPSTRVAYDPAAVTSFHSIL